MAGEGEKERKGRQGGHGRNGGGMLGGRDKGREMSELTGSVLERSTGQERDQEE